MDGPCVFVCACVCVCVWAAEKVPLYTTTRLVLFFLYVYIYIKNYWATTTTTKNKNNNQPSTHTPQYVHRLHRFHTNTRSTPQMNRFLQSIRNEFRHQSKALRFDMSRPTTPLLIYTSSSSVTDEDVLRCSDFKTSTDVVAGTSLSLVALYAIDTVKWGP